MMRNTTVAEHCALTLPEFAIYFYVQPGICFIGFILNIVNCIVFCKPPFVSPAYKFMIALAVADATTLFLTFPIGFQRCKGFFDACLSPGFKRFRLLLSYYTAYFQFPVTNASETASIFLTTLLSMERYMTMHNISCSNKTKTHTFLNGLSCYGKRVSSTEPDTTDNHDFDSNSDRDCEGLRIILIPITSLCSGIRESVKLAIIKVAVLSIALNIPLFFCQQVVTREVIIATDTKTGTPARTTLKWGVGVTAFGNSRFYSIYTWLRTVFLQIIPFIFLCLINFYLFKFIRMANARWKSKLTASLPNKLGDLPLTPPDQPTIDRDSSNVQQTSYANPIIGNMVTSNLRNIRRQNAQRKLTVLLIAIVALFLAGQIPQAFAFAAIYQAILNLSGAGPRKLACSPPYRLYRVTTNCICLLTYSANFLLYATLNTHFKRELARWFSVLKCKRRLKNLKSFDDTGAEEMHHQVRPHFSRAVASTDCVTKGRQQPPPVGGPMSDVLPVVTNGTNHDSFYSTRPCSEYTWRASVAVLSKKGGRPVAVATATLDRSVSTSSNRSQMETWSMIQRHSTSAGHLPHIFRTEQGGTNEVTCFLNTHSRKSFYSTVSERPSSRKKRDLNEYIPAEHNDQVNESVGHGLSNSSNKMIFRISCHSKHFWVRRWKTLTRTSLPGSNKSMNRVQTNPNVDGTKLLLSLDSSNLQSGNRRRHPEKVQIDIRPGVFTPEQVAPAILFGLSRAQRGGTLEETFSKNVPILYLETHLDSVL